MVVFVGMLASKRGVVGAMISVVAVVFMLTGCSGGSYRIVAGDVVSDPGEISGSYRRFSGFYEQTASLDAGAEVTTRLEIETQEGSLSALVEDPEGETVVTLQPNVSGSDTEQRVSERFRIPKDGSYTFKVEADDHRGNFLLEWESN
jgi:hypothetical protein